MNRCPQCGHFHLAGSCKDTIEPTRDYCQSCGFVVAQCQCGDAPGLITTLPATIHATPYETIARDRFIAAAMMGILANPDTSQRLDSAEQLGGWAIKDADAVMKARAK